MKHATMQIAESVQNSLGARLLGQLVLVAMFCLAGGCQLSRDVWQRAGQDHVSTEPIGARFGGDGSVAVLVNVEHNPALLPEYTRTRWYVWTSSEVSELWRRQQRTKGGVRTDSLTLVADPENYAHPSTGQPGRFVPDMGCSRDCVPEDLPEPLRSAKHLGLREGLVRDGPPGSRDSVPATCEVAGRQAMVEIRGSGFACYRTTTGHVLRVTYMPGAMVLDVFWTPFYYYLGALWFGPAAVWVR